MYTSFICRCTRQKQASSCHLTPGFPGLICVRATSKRGVVHYQSPVLSFAPSLDRRWGTSGLNKTTDPSLCREHDVTFLDPYLPTTKTNKMSFFHFHSKKPHPWLHCSLFLPRTPFKAFSRSKCSAWPLSAERNAASAMCLVGCTGIAALW